MKRRTLLAGAGVGIGALAGCYAANVWDRDPVGTDDAAGDASAGRSGPHLPFDVWTEIREALRESPDHLPARADRLVREGDPEAIFRFVRDGIRTLPTSDTDIGDYRDRVRWGVRGTLRGGAGTPREKAELLAALYRRAGWEADVLVGGDGLDEAAVRRLLLGQVEHPFEPAVDDGTLDRWTETLGTEPVEVSPVDPTGDEARALARRVEAALPPADDRYHVSAFDWRWGSETLVVRVRVDGERLYANLFTPDTPFGEAGTEPGDLEPADPTEPLPELSVTLSAAVAPAVAPDDRLELATATWNMEDVIGRQLLVRTLPGVDPLDNPGVTFRDVRTVLPSLAVQGADLDRETASELSTLGDAVTLSGARLTVDDDGVRRDGAPLVATADSGAGGDVDSLEVVGVDATRYPEVKLEVRAHDAAGDVVEGVPATGFVVEDDGSPVGVAVEATRAVPRVVVLSDTSASMPREYLDEAMEAFVGRLQDSITAAYPGAVVTHRATDSDLWSALADAAASEANVIAYVTDGHVNDERTPAVDRALAAGPPAVMVNVTGYDQPPLTEMAAATGGVVALADDPRAAERALLDFLDDVDYVPYVLTYAADRRGTAGSERTVVVRAAASGASGSGSYVVPVEPVLPPQLCGLYLHVELGDRAVTRTLAGYDPLREGVEGPVTRAHLDETFDALFGSTYLSVEAEAPSPSVAYDDFLAMKGSVADLDAALVSGDPEAIRAARDRGASFVPGDLLAAVRPLPGATTETTLTFSDGPRLTLYHERPVLGADYARKRVDYLPLSRFATVADRPEDAFRTTLERTAHLALVEAAMFETSTRSLLAGAELAEFDAAYDTLERDLASAWRTYGRGTWPSDRDYQLVPVDGAPFAYWNVDHETGSLLGILPDGSGGGSTESEIDGFIRHTDRVIDAFSLFLVAAGAAASAVAGGAPAIAVSVAFFSLGVVAAYGSTLIRLYGAAAMAIATMDASGLDRRVRVALAIAACNIAMAFMALSPAGEAIAGLTYLIGAMGGSAPTSCTGLDS